MEMQYDHRNQRLVVTFGAEAMSSTSVSAVIYNMVNGGVNKRMGANAFKHFLTLSRVIVDRSDGTVNIVFNNVGIPIMRYGEKQDDLWTHVNYAKRCLKAAMCVK